MSRRIMAPLTGVVGAQKPLPSNDPAGFEPATYGLKERMLIGFLTLFRIGKPAVGLAFHPEPYSARIY